MMTRRSLLPILWLLAATQGMAQVFQFSIGDPTKTREVGHVPYYVDTINLNRAGDTLLLGARKNNAERVFSLNSHTGKLIQLSPDTAPKAYEPTFAADQQGILFDQLTPGPQIFLTDRHWQTPKLVINNGGGAQVSGDGTWIVFSRQSPQFNFILYVAHSDGSGEQQASPSTSDALNASFAPTDPGKVLYVDFGIGIVISKIDGTGRQVLLSDKNALEPRFSPDGSQIIYSSSQGATPKYDIYVMNADGTHSRRLTSQSGIWFRSPLFGPDGKTVYHLELPISRASDFQENWRRLHGMKDESSH